jgi:hypothetical protein
LGKGGDVVGFSDGHFDSSHARATRIDIGRACHIPPLPHEEEEPAEPA